MNIKSIVTYSNDNYKVLVPSALSSDIVLQSMPSDPEYIGVACQVTEPTNVYVLYKLNCENYGNDPFGSYGTGTCLFVGDDPFTLEYRNSEVLNSADTKVVNDTLYNVLESNTFSTAKSQDVLQVRYVAMKLTITPDSVSTHTYISDRPRIYKSIQSHPYTIQSGTSVGGVNASLASCMMACACNSGSGDVKYAFTSSYHQNQFKPLGSTTNTNLVHINDTMTVSERVKFILGYVKEVSRQFYFHDKVIEAAAMALTRDSEIPEPSGDTLPVIAMTLELSLSGTDFGTVAWSYVPSESFISTSTQEDFEDNIAVFDIDSMTADSPLITMLVQSAPEDMSGSMFGGIKGIKVGNVLIAVMVNVHVTNQKMDGNTACYINSLPDTVPSAYTAQVEALQAAITSAKSEYGSVLTDLNEAQDSLDEVQNELTEKQEALTTAQEDLATAQATLAAVQTELTTKQSNLTNLQAELTALQETYAEAEANMGAVTEQYEYLQREVTELQAELAELTTDVIAKQSELTNLTQQITLSNNTIVNLQVRLTQLQSDISSAQMNKELVQSELDAVIAALNDLEASPEYQTYINLQQQLQSVREALTEVTEAYENVQAEYNQLVQMTYNETRVCKAKDKCPWASVNILNGFIETIDYGD